MSMWNVFDAYFSSYLAEPEQYIIKVEYHADTEYENPLKNSEKIAGVGQRLLYLIMEKKK